MSKIVWKKPVFTVDSITASLDCHCKCIGAAGGGAGTGEEK